MNYPYGPYGQGSPGQPGHPQQSGYPPQPVYPHQQPGYQQPSYPQHGGYPGGYQYPPMPPPSPSGATAIIASVLAGLGGLANVVGGIFMAFGLAAIVSESTSDTDSGVWTGLIAITMLNIVAGLLLATGTVMLLLRKAASRWIVVAGCAVSIVSSLTSIGMPSRIAEYEYSGTGSDVVGLVFPIATIVLVLLPSTAAWIHTKRNSPAPLNHPPYPG